ncbi:DUF6527 family protein [Mycolicibacterium neoaurum]|uniref:DUF6527 family protein n=1 Tax=Mycolicibacterium neoaurum TaxID=1795 RepID=UPI003AFF8848
MPDLPCREAYGRLPGSAPTPFGRHDWTLTFDGTVSLHPSIGNGQQSCRSHYNIRNDRVEWLPRISKRATQLASDRDRAAHTQHPTPLAPRPWWRRIWDRVTRVRTATERSGLIRSGYSSSELLVRCM